MIHASHVSVRLHGKTILDDVSLALRPGEVTVVIGPNGAGKSTLLSVLAGDLRPDQGTVTLEGTDVRHWRAQQAARARAVMVQDSQVSFPFAVRDVVRMGRNAWRRTPEGDRDEEIVDDALRATEIEHLVDRTVTVLSGGERQRTALARVLAQQGRTVLLDEPVSAMDIAHQERTLQLCRKLAGEGHAVAVVLHDLDAATVYGDRVVLMNHGTVVADGTSAEVCTSERLTAVYGTPIDVFEVRGVTRVAPYRTRG